jgi:hypothetical protein
MKFSDRIYAIGNFKKKRLRIRYITAPCSLANQSADHLQTICNPMLGFFPVSLEAFRRGSIRFD